MIKKGSAFDGDAIQYVSADGGRPAGSQEGEDGLAWFASDLENPCGQGATASNVSFCGVVTETDETREA